MLQKARTNKFFLQFRTDVDRPCTSGQGLSASNSQPSVLTAAQCAKHLSLLCHPNCRQCGRTAAICAVFPSNATHLESKEHKTCQATCCFPIPAISRNCILETQNFSCSMSPSNTHLHFCYLSHQGSQSFLNLMTAAAGAQTETEGV